MQQHRGALAAHEITKGHGAHAVLERVSLPVPPRARIGLVGPNGVGKSTLLRLLAGLDEPDGGRIERSPATLTVGYLPQEVDADPAETLLAYLRRRTGVADAEAAVEAQAAALARDAAAADGYAAALDRLVALGAGDLDARSAVVAARLGLPREALGRPLGALSGGERARAALAAILLARFDVLLLDEPTNDLDFAGLALLERFLAATDAALVVVSHDRAFLDATVTRIAELEPGSRSLREWAGGWSAFEAARGAARARQYAEFELAAERRAHVAALLAQRRTEARGHGAKADRRGTNALRTKVRQAERALGHVGGPEKPFEPWELRLSFGQAERGGDTLAELAGAVVERGAFRLGPVDLAVRPGERVAVAGPNGSGKSTLLAALLGELPLASGTRALGRSTVPGTLDQTRAAYAGGEPLLDVVRARAGLTPLDARTLLAKFGLGADDVGRPCATLSPGERTRAQLAELAARGVNLLVLDEPTNHLDLEAVEQLEAALDAYRGAVVAVSHDRRFLERLAPTRTLAL